MWSPLALALLLLATGEGVALALLLAERRRIELALGEMQRELQATLDAAERAASASEELRDRSPSAIGFRARST